MNFQSQKATKGLATTANLPAWICGEHRKRHPLSELLCDVFRQGRPEEERFFYVWWKQVNTMVRSRLTWAEWCQDWGLQGREQTGSDYCWFKDSMLKTTTEQIYSNSFTRTYLLWMLGWAHIISARTFNESMKIKTNNLEGWIDLCINLCVRHKFGKVKPLSDFICVFP